MNILLTHAYSLRNKGDAAILEVTLLELARVFPDAKITVCAIDDLGASKSKNITYRRSLFFHEVYKDSFFPIRILRVVAVPIAVTFWALIYRLMGVRFNLFFSENLRNLLNEYAECDVIVTIGGGYLASYKSMRSRIALVLNLHAIWIGTLLQKKTIFFSQSIGPVYGGWMKSFVYFVLRRVNTIFVREEHSETFLKDLGLSVSSIHYVADAGFLFSTSKKEAMREYLTYNEVSLDKTLVGITLRNWLPFEQQLIFEKAISFFIQDLVRRGMQVAMIPQVTATLTNDDDRVVHARVRGLLSADLKKSVFFFEEEYDPFEIKGLYENLDYLIGNRMHSVIFALTAHVPAIAIEYEYKTGGIMKDLGLAQWVIKMEDVRGKILTDKFDSLVENRDKYFKDLDGKFSTYVESAKGPANFLKGALYRNEK